MRRRKQPKQSAGNDIITFILVIAGIIGLILFLTSCSAVKRVNKDERKQLKVIADYSKKHPAKNDTVFKLVPGDTIIQTDEKFDTLYYDVSDTVLIPEYKYKTVVKTVTITKTVRDTILKTIVDRSKEKALQDIVNNADRKYLDMKADFLDMQHKRNKWRTWFFILVGVNIVYLYFRIRFKL